MLSRLERLLHGDRQSPACIDVGNRGEVLDRAEPPGSPRIVAASQVSVGIVGRRKHHPESLISNCGHRRVVSERECHLSGQLARQSTLEEGLRSRYRTGEGRVGLADAPHHAHVPPALRRDRAGRIRRNAITLRSGIVLPRDGESSTALSANLWTHAGGRQTPRRTLSRTPARIRLFGGPN
jgi:hypothetical protein